MNRAALETATPFGGTRGQFAVSFLSPKGFASSSFRPDLLGEDGLFLYRFFGAIDNPTDEAVKLSGKTVLTDNADFADADTFLYFSDTVFFPSDSLKISNKFFVDAYQREKVSRRSSSRVSSNACSTWRTLSKWP